MEDFFPLILIFDPPPATVLGRRLLSRLVQYAFCKSMDTPKTCWLSPSLISTLMDDFSFRKIRQTVSRPNKFAYGKTKKRDLHFPSIFTSKLFFNFASEASFEPKIKYDHPNLYRYLIFKYMRDNATSTKICTREAVV